MSRALADPDSSSRAGAPVSVVIPCYRCHRTIGRAIDSVARQTSIPAEVIVVEDGSGDHTLEILLEVKHRLGKDWIKVIALDRNEGVAAARNAGWNVASGRYVAFLDADDAWHPCKVELQLAFMEAHPEVALSGHAHRRLREEEPLDTPFGEPGLTEVTFGMLLRSNRFITPSAMVRRDVPLRFLPDRRYMEDHLLWLEMVSRGLRVVRLSQVLAFTYKAPVGESGLSASAWEMRKAELANLWRLRSDGRIGSVAAVALCGYALTKHCVRLLATTLRPKSV